MLLLPAQSALGACYDQVGNHNGWLVIAGTNRYAGLQSKQDCSYFNKPGGDAFCKLFKWTGEGQSPTELCCACGGGTDTGPSPPPPSPSPSPPVITRFSLTPSPPPRYPVSCFDHPPVGNGWLKYRNKQQWVPDTEATTCASIGPNHPTFAGAPFNETTCADYKWHVPGDATAGDPLVMCCACGGGDMRAAAAAVAAAPRRRPAVAAGAPAPPPPCTDILPPEASNPEHGARLELDQGRQGLQLATTAARLRPRRPRPRGVTPAPPPEAVLFAAAPSPPSPAHPPGAPAGEPHPRRRRRRLPRRRRRRRRRRCCRRRPRSPRRSPPTSRRRRAAVPSAAAVAAGAHRRSLGHGDGDRAHVRPDHHEREPRVRRGGRRKRIADVIGVDEGDVSLKFVPPETIEVTVLFPDPGEAEAAKAKLRGLKLRAPTTSSTRRHDRVCADCAEIVAVVVAEAPGGRRPRGAVAAGAAGPLHCQGITAQEEPYAARSPASSSPRSSAAAWRAR